jgi:phage terminase small subunit
MPNKHNDQQERFCEEYLIDFNGTAAVIRAGYSKRSAARQAVRLLAMPHVQESLRQKKAVIKSKLQISQQRTLLEIGRLAFSDIRKAFTDDGRLKPIHELDDDTAAAIAAFDCEELFEYMDGDKSPLGQIKKYKFWDKLRALEMLAKHYGLLGDEDKNDMKFSVVIKAPAAKEEPAKARARNGK